MKIKPNNKRKAKVRAALKKVNKKHGGILAKLGGGIDNELREDVVSLIEKYRGAFKRLTKK